MCELREVGVIYLGVDPMVCELREVGVIDQGLDPMLCELKRGRCNLSMFVNPEVKVLFI